MQQLTKHHRHNPVPQSKMVSIRTQYTSSITILAIFMCANHVSGLFSKSIMGIRNAVAPPLIKTLHDNNADKESATTAANTSKSDNAKVLVEPRSLASLFRGVPCSFIRKIVTAESSDGSIQMLGKTSDGQGKRDKGAIRR